MKMSAIEHLETLRRHLIIAMLVWIACALLCWNFVDVIFHALLLPLQRISPDHAKLIYTGISESFLTYLKTALAAATFLASPFILHQLWRFIAPGLYLREKKTAWLICSLTLFCFVGGGIFGYLVVFPMLLEFFLGYSSQFIQPFLSMKEYFSFSLQIIMVFGLAFELPMVIVVLIKTRLVTVQSLKQNRRYVILANVIVAALLTPPDIISQFCMALPLIVLYELGLGLGQLLKPTRSAK